MTKLYWGKRFGGLSNPKPTAPEKQSLANANDFLKTQRIWEARAQSRIQRGLDATWELSRARAWGEEARKAAGNA